MAEIAGLPPVVAAGPVGRPNIDAAQVLFAAAPALGQSSTQSEAEARGAPSALTTALPGPKLDENTLAGPPPAFQVSLMELDAALLKSLARINAEQSFAKANPERDKALEILNTSRTEPSEDTAQETDPLTPSETNDPAEDAAWLVEGTIRPEPTAPVASEIPPDVIPQTQIAKPAMVAFGPVSTAAISDPLGAEG